MTPDTKDFSVTPPNANTFSEALLPPNDSEDESKNPSFTPNKSKPGVNFFMGKNRLGEKPFFQKN